MGLDYSYMLYFKRDQLADVLQGVADIAEKHHPPTRIHFPDRVVDVPLGSWRSEEKILQYDDAELGFDTVLIFDEDEAILDWGHGQVVDDSFRSPPETETANLVSIGYIYLTVYNDLSQYFPEKDLKDLVLFDFGTTGTRMSKLFYYSTSIRKKFIELIRKYNGVCGVFNNEEEGEVFWLNGREMNEYITDPWMLPEEIERELFERGANS
jgi:hypothetical protein